MAADAGSSGLRIPSTTTANSGMANPPCRG
jgi:hypothetical protein